MPKGPVILNNFGEGCRRINDNLKGVRCIRKFRNHFSLALSLHQHPLEQWYSTWGTRTPGGMRRYLRGYVKFKKINILFYDKH
jgi:hypothetical protein